MSLASQMPDFCVVCLKSIKPQVHAARSIRSEKINQFIKFLTRFVGNYSAQKGQLLTSNYVCLTCEECDPTIDTFCEIYHQIKSLELKLDLKLDKLVSIIKLSSRIPTRWTNLNKVLQLTHQDDEKIIEENKNEILTIRQNIIEAGLHRSSKSQPRVLLKSHTNNVTDEPLLDKNDVLSEETAVEYTPPEDPLTCQNQDEEINPAIILIRSENYPKLQIILNDPAIPVPDDFSVPVLEIPCSTKHLSNDPAFYTCYICQRKVLPTMKRHHYKCFHDVNRLASEDDIVKCKADGCDAYFLREKQLVEHQKAQHVETEKISTTNINGDEYFQCKVCKTHFDNITFLKRHLKTTRCRLDHKIGLEEPIQCIECKISFDTKEVFWEHQNLFHSFGKDKVCPKCGKTFNKTASYKIHMEYHKGPGEWKWECSQCKKRFADVNGLKRHAKSHLNAKLVKMKGLKKKSGEDVNKNGGTPSGPLISRETSGPAEDFMELSEKEEWNFELHADDIKLEEDPLEILPT